MLLHAGTASSCTPPSKTATLCSGENGYRAELVRAARRGLEFDPVTGEPVGWAAPQRAATTWYRLALAYTDMKWSDLAAHSRASMAEALATVTPAPTTATGQRPPAQVLRAALYGHAFNPQRQSGNPDPGTAAALAWLERASLPVTRLQDPQVTRQALDALTVRLDHRRAAANTIARKRAVFHNALGYAVELGLLEANPLGQHQRRTPRAASTADPRVIASPGQVDAIFKQVARIRPELTAFFGCPYYAALRPEEAVALRRDGLILPASGWGQLTLTAALPRSARLDRQRHRTRTSRPKAPPRRRHQNRSHPAAASLPPPLAPAGTRHRARRAAVPRCPRRPAQRKPLRPDLAPGPCRSIHLRPARQPPGTAPLRPAARGAVTVAGLRCSPGRYRRPRRAQRACPAHRLHPLHTRPRPDRQPAHRAGPRHALAARSWPTKTPGHRADSVRHASVSQLDTRGTPLDPARHARTGNPPVTCGNTRPRDLPYQLAP